MPYRVDLPHPPDDALDRLVALGALDVEPTAAGLAALLPDAVDAATLAGRLGVEHMAVSEAVARDDGSVWVLKPRPLLAGGLLFLPADHQPAPGALRLSDGPAFGTGLHPTTALCLEVLAHLMEAGTPAAALDVGTGSGILALAALSRGVGRVVGLDVDAAALRVASENARLNGLARQLHLVCGGPEALNGRWPLVLANILAAPLMEMAPSMAQRVDRGGRLVLSGLPASLAPDVEQVYRRAGMRQVQSDTRNGWSVLVLTRWW